MSQTPCLDKVLLARPYVREEHGKLEQVSGYVRGGAVHAMLGKPDMTEEEHDALREYGFSEYGAVNSALRGGKLTGKPAQRVAHIDRIFARARPTSRAMVVYRGGRLAPAEKGYVSTTSQEDSALRWGQQVHKIIVPAGAKVLSVSQAGNERWFPAGQPPGEHSTTVGEGEVLLPRGSKFRKLAPGHWALISAQP